MRRMGLLVGGRTRWSDRKRIRRAILIGSIPIVAGLALTGWNILQHWMAQ
jgi:hypothetical protein